MISRRNLFLSLCVLLSQFAMGQHTNKLSDSLSVKGHSNKDTLSICVVASGAKYQMSFLMQGMEVSIKDTSNITIASIQLPNAREARGRLNHHPNEVKAMHGSNGHEIRPDLGPLISVLNQIESISSDSTGGQIEGCHHITIDKEEGLMTFLIRFAKLECIQPNDTVIIDITSKPIEAQREFSGRLLSRENRRPPGGLGQAPEMLNDINRNIHIQKRIIIENK